MATETNILATEESQHVLIGWELGGGLAHMTRIAAIAKGLIGRGCRVSLCLQDLSNAYQIIGNLPVYIYQAPVWLPRLRTDRQPVCFSDILIHRGYGSAVGLYSLVQAWESLFKSIQPDLLILDYAPTALLAARGWDIPKVLISSGFGERAAGLPDMCVRPWQKNAEAMTRSSEKRVVDVVNRVLIKRNAPTIHYISDIYQVDHTFLFMVPEIDLETERVNATYLRPPKEPGNLQPARWPPGEGRKVFAYLKRSSLQCLNMIQSIAETDCVGLVVCGGLSKEEVEKFQRPGLIIHSDYRDITKVLEEADVVICHAGKNTISEALLAGKPLLLIPEQLEQFHNARQVEKHGAGIFLTKDASLSQVREALQHLLNQQECRFAAEQIAVANAALAQCDPVRQVSDVCLKLISEP